MKPIYNLISNFGAFFEFTSVIVLSVTVNIFTTELDSNPFPFSLLLSLIILFISSAIGFFLGEKIKSRVLLAEKEYKNNKITKAYEDCIYDKFKESCIGLSAIALLIFLILGVICLINSYS